LAPVTTMNRDDTDTAHLRTLSAHCSDEAAP
jgi:hypothetical protein